MIKIDLFGEIGWEVTINSVKDAINNNKNEDINFVISSLGGDVNHGLAIHDLIKTHSGKTKATIIGMTASAGTIIAMSCDEIEMSENALFLIHNSWTFTEGNKEDFNKTIKDLQQIDNIMVGIYQKKTGLKNEEITELMNAENWLTAEEAKELGLVNSVIKNEYKIAANYKLLPKDIYIKLSNKMKLFKNKESKPFVFALKDGSNILANAEVLAEKVEVIPVGAATLENGSYELADGRSITIEDGVITEVTEKEMEAGEGNEIIDAVADVVAEQLAAFETKFDAKIEALKTTKSSGKPPKNDNSSKEDIKTDVLGNVRAKVKANFDNIKKKREA